MSAGTPRLTLLAPGLLGARPGAGGMPSLPGVRRPALAKMLARADRWSEPADADALRYRLFGCAPCDECDRPDAWLSYRIDTGAAAPGALLRADPVHLRADRSRLVLFEGAPLQIAGDELEALADTFNRYYAADGLRLEFTASGHGYLHLPRQPDVRTAPLARARGRDIDALLPAGKEGRAWQRFLNEVQMLFHDHPVNRGREARGRPPINSVWLWGGGPAPVAAPSDWKRVWCDDSVSRGLAGLNGIECSEPPTDARAWLHEAVGGRHLVCLDGLRRPIAYGDAEAWLEEAGRLERDWFAPLLRALRRGGLREAVLYPDDGRAYRITRQGLWRFWRRPRHPPQA